MSKLTRRGAIKLVAGGAAAAGIPSAGAASEPTAQNVWKQVSANKGVVAANTGIRRFKIAPVDQNARYSVTVTANHNNHLRMGGWHVHYIHTGDYERGGLRPSEPEVKFGRDTFRTEVLAENGEVILEIRNTSTHELNTLIIVVEGFLPAVYHDLPTV